MADHDLLPNLRRKRIVLIDRLNILYPAVRETERQLEEVDRLIKENDFYHPPPRPTI